MRAVEILKFVREVPFQPFRIFMSDGSSYEVPHPEMIMVNQTRVYVGVQPNRHGVPMTSVSCDPVHITRIAPIKSG